MPIVLFILIAFFSQPMAGKCHYGNYQRWSRGHKARGQGQGHKKKKKIRGQGQEQPFRGQTFSRPRTRMLEAKAKNQGHSRKCSLKKRSSKFFFRQFPIYRRCQNFDWGGPNHKSHAMTSSKICLFHVTRILQRERA